MAVRTQDILFRAGGGTLKRLQTLVSAGAGRAEVAHTFSRDDAVTSATFRDRDGGLRKASANVLRLEYPYSYGDYGITLEGAATQLMTDTENFGLWSLDNVTRTAGQTDPFGGTGAYLLDAGLSVSYSTYHTITFSAGTATRAIGLYLKAGTSPQTAFSVYDSTAGVQRHLVLVTWTAGVPSLTTGSGGGTLFSVEDQGGGLVSARCWRE